jgi:hypothetical protein
MVTLANEIPWIMAIQNTQQAFKLATVSVMTMLTLAAMMMHIVIN